MTIQDMNLSVRARNSLMRAGIRTTEQLMTMDAGDLLKIRNLGQKTLDEIQGAMKLLEKREQKEVQKIAPRGSYLHGYQEGADAMRRAAIRELTKRSRHMTIDQQQIFSKACDLIKEIEVL